MLNNNISDLREKFRSQKMTTRSPPTTRGPTSTVAANTAGATTAGVNVEYDQRSTDQILGIKKKRRLIQILIELLGSPDPSDDSGENQWEGDRGVINTIRDFCAFKSTNSRGQIRDVITYVWRSQQQGVQDIDARFKSGAYRSVRKRLLTREDDELVVKTLDVSLGVEMDWEILNHKRVKEGRLKVDETTVRRSAHSAFGGSCHKRPLRKTGSTDKERVCICITDRAANCTIIRICIRYA